MTKPEFEMPKFETVGNIYPVKFNAFGTIVNKTITRDLLMYLMLDEEAAIFGLAEEFHGHA